MIKAYAATEAGGSLTAFEYDAKPVGPGDVEIAVESCGICHSDLSMIDNEWGLTGYPIVPGHEIVGRVAKAGAGVAHLKEGDRVGLGWCSSSCLHCQPCMSGDHNMCVTVEQTIVGRHGGFADRVVCGAEWAVAIPDGVDAAKAGPLFCGGVTVFNPIVQLNVRPTDRVGVVGVGGLGHLAIKFLSKWGCEVTAFTSSGAKTDEARAMGAHHVVDSRDGDAVAGLAGRLDVIISTVNVPLQWDAYFAALGPRGRLHTVGAVLEPIPTAAFSLIMGQKSLSGSPLGSPAVVADMLEFCARHEIAPTTEHFPMSKVNDALAHLRDGKARYRVVLDADF